MAASGKYKENAEWKREHGCRECHPDRNDPERIPKWGWRPGGRHGGWLDAYVPEFKGDTLKLIDESMSGRYEEVLEASKFFLMEKDDRDAAPKLKQQKTTVRICRNVIGQLMDILGRGRKSMDAKSRSLIETGLVLKYGIDRIVMTELLQSLQCVWMCCILAERDLDNMLHDQANWCEKRFARSIREILDKGQSPATHYVNGTYAKVLKLLIRDLTGQEPGDNRVKHLLADVFAQSRDPLR